MPLGNAGPWQLLLILVIVLLIFGAARLPALAKSLGQSARVFRGEMKQMKDDGKTESKSADDEAGAGSTSAEPRTGSPESKP
ncbi:twin-arginine translocase TatA/TatE family subunit [Microbacterium album]|uniref:Sec-independent protein translocase protein TatA n=1 Tax=Microbacterium album TaxID=2053191 RepID=A0A917IDQ1_9MICO|nr:twin-arginine translocase TatA/TatE family subunit [Microbacterium album]GGH35213.1 hypothetical protein GCM10010921_03470 [Microbacterium album]